MNIYIFTLGASTFSDYACILQRALARDTTAKCGKSGVQSQSRSSNPLFRPKYELENERVVNDIRPTLMPLCIGNPVVKDKTTLRATHFLNIIFTPNYDQ